MMILSYLREPLWLLLALAPVILIGVAALLKHYRANTYSDPEFNDWVITASSNEHKHRFRQLIFIQLAWLAFAIAIAGPRLPEKILDSQQHYNKDVMVVFDVSLSMSARDIRPNRIERAKLELLDLVERLDNTRLGIIVYAAQPHLLLPPTSDKQLLKHYIQSLRTQWLPTEGSGLFDALRFSVLQLSSYKASASKASTSTASESTAVPSALPGAMILISDGEVNLSATDTSHAIQNLTANMKQHNIRLYTLGAGTSQGAPLLSAQSGWLEVDNQAVISQLNETLLTTLATIGNGSYSPITDDDSDWNRLYNDGITTLSYQSTDDVVSEKILWQEEYHWFVIAGLVFFLLGLWQPQPSQTNQPGRHSPSSTLESSQASTPALLLVMFIIMSFSTFGAVQPVHAADHGYNNAYDLYQQGDYQAAREGFTRVPGYTGRLAEGIMAYQLEQYQLAIPAFIQAALDADTDQQRIQAIFNLANSYFKLEKYVQARQLYEDVLRYQANFRPAQVNLEYAIALIQEAEDNNYPVALRQGNGPSTADAPEDMDVTTGKLSLGDSESDLETMGGDQDRTGFDTTTPSEVRADLEHSAPASEKIEQNEDTSWTYDVTSLRQLQQLNPKIQTDESVLWQRLFEVEEDFEAAQDEPTVLPGVNPW